MDADLKAKWIAALRSGEYAQTQGHLERHGGYCCLGVLNVVGAIGVRDAEGDYYNRFLQHMSDEQVTECITMNDHDRKTFPEIADWVEKTL